MIPYILIRAFGLAVLVAVVAGYIAGAVAAKAFGPYVGDDVSLIVAAIVGAYTMTAATFHSMEEIGGRFYAKQRPRP